MCPHVLCLSLIAPTTISLSSPSPLLFSLSLPSLLHSLSLLHFCCYTSTMKARSRMCSTAPHRHEFLKKWIEGLHICRSINIIPDSKTAIKLSADVAIASTRNATTQWSQALMCDVVSRHRSNKILVEQISGRKLAYNRALITCSSSRILKRSLIRRKAARRVVPKCSATSIARKLVKNRTRVLKKLVPGGEGMDGISLIRETLDYIVSLRVQVDVMRRLAAAAERLEPSRNILICN